MLKIIGFRFQGFKFQGSGSGFKFQGSSLGFQVSGFRIQVFCSCNPTDTKAFDKGWNAFIKRDTIVIKLCISFIVDKANIWSPNYLRANLPTWSFSYIKEVLELLIAITFVTFSNIIHNATSSCMDLLNKARIVFPWFITCYTINVFA